MASSSGRTDSPLIRALLDRGYEFQFFQAVRLLALLYPDRQPVPAPVPRNEIVRFEAKAALGFPPSEIHRIVPDSQDILRMTVAFMGLYGPSGVLPHHYTQRIIWLGKHDTALAEFFDLFNHRLISWHYRAWEKHRVLVGYERRARTRQTTDPAALDADRFTHYLFDLIGMGTEGLRGRLNIDDSIPLFYAGLIGQRPHSASALGGILRDYFGVPVTIRQFSGRWLYLEDHSLTRPREKAHNKLGYDAVAGDAVWSLQAGFRIDVGPLDFTRFRAFLPDGSAYRKLVVLARFFAGETLQFDVRLTLAAGDVPWPRLTDEGIDAPRLGWMGWLKTEEFSYPTSDAHFAGVC
jgi:type VI secretion system protein ImpH